MENSQRNFNESEKTQMNFQYFLNLDKYLIKLLISRKCDFVEWLEMQIYGAQSIRFQIGNIVACLIQCADFEVGS